MRRYEIIGGIIWFIIYAFVIGIVLELALALLGVSYDEATLNAVYFFSNFIITALLFRRFLSYSLPVAADNLLRTLKAILLGFALYWILEVGLSLLSTLRVQEDTIPNDDTIQAIAGINYRVMWVGAVLLAPMTEETLVRGLVFGNLRRKSRVLAYVVTALLFASMHTLGYVTEMSALSIVYNMLIYGLPSVALCVCYEYAGTIWAPIALHMIINAIGMSGIA
jgi:membrane protease YdiL (CAAX protease family)